MAQMVEHLTQGCEFKFQFCQGKKGGSEKEREGEREGGREGRKEGTLRLNFRKIYNYAKNFVNFFLLLLYSQY
jgi:hypothetical protein